MKKTVLVIAFSCSLPALASAQQDGRRVRAYVDYIAGKSLYISAGQQQGLFEADTVDAYREGATTPLGRLVIVSSTRSRAVATFAAEAFALTRGDVLMLELGAPALAKLDALRAQQDTVPKVTVAAGQPEAESPLRRVRRAPGVDGRIGLDVDAFQNMTQWGDGPDERDDVTYTTPALRLYLTTTDLPGGIRLTANLRASYYGNSATTEQRMSVQTYEASVHSDFGGAPVQLRAGRFYNPFESHSGYWDGALLRFGPRSMGAGVVFGFEPLLGNQAFSTDAPKTTFFIDAHKRSGLIRYDGDVSIHRQTRQLIGDRREFLGVSQRFSFGRTYITQRLQIGRDSSHNTQLWQMQVTASAALIGPLQVNARYSSDRNDLYLLGADLGSKRVRRTVGLAVAGNFGYTSVDAGDVDTGTGKLGRTIAFNSALPRLLAGFGVMVSSSYTTESTFNATYASTSFDHYLGRVLARAGVRYYRTNFGASLFEQRGGEITLAVPLPDRTDLTITAGTTRGANNYSNRVLMSLWKSF